MTWLRWQAFKALSFIGWRICPEPHRSNLQSIMPQWQDIDESQLEGDLRAELSDISFSGARK